MSERVGKKRRTDRFRWIWLLIPICLLGLVVRFAFVAVHARPIGLGQEMMADDFGFTVVGVEAATKVQAAAKAFEPKGKYLVIDLQVANHAKLVNFRFDPNSFVVEDELGNRYYLDNVAQNSIDSFGSSINTLAAGESCRRKIVFDVPKDLVNPKLRIAFGGRFGEIVDWFLYGNRWFEIPEWSAPAADNPPD